MWEEEAKRKFPSGSRVFGTVLKHAPFGIFVDLGDPLVIGLVNMPEFLDEGRMTLEQYPPIGASIEAMVLGHSLHNKQVTMTLKPSRVREKG